MRMPKPPAWKVWNIACLHRDATTWSTQISGVALSSLDALGVLTRHVAERVDQNYHPVVSAVISNTEDAYFSSYRVTPKGRVVAG